MKKKILSKLNNICSIGPKFAKWLTFTPLCQGLLDGTKSGERGLQFGRVTKWSHPNQWNKWAPILIYG